MTHLLHHKLISPTQYAFRPNSNPTLALQTIINYIHKQRNQNKPTLAIYVDLSKAYDTISHQKLLHKLLHEFNFTPATATFFQSYFTNRQQSTHTQHATSGTQTVTHGIPQGSSLSTTLFLLYINNIIKNVPNSKVYTYADDTTLIITVDNPNDLQQLAQTELNNLIKYFHANNLVPNPTKTQFTIFKPHQKQPISHSKSTMTKSTKQHTLPYSESLSRKTQVLYKHEHTIRQICIKKPQPFIQILYSNA